MKRLTIVRYRIGPHDLVPRFNRLIILGIALLLTEFHFSDVEKSWGAPRTFEFGAMGKRRSRRRGKAILSDHRNSQPARSSEDGIVRLVAIEKSSKCAETLLLLHINLRKFHRLLES